MGTGALPRDAEVQLLWTGGWDSTFRLLWVAVVEGRTVQPYYIAATGRASTEAELAAIEAIIARLASTNPAAATRVRSLIVHEEKAIRHDREICVSFDRILSRRFVGSQYRWLAEFCSQFELDGLELSVHKDDKAHLLLESMVNPPASGDEPIVVHARHRGSEEYLVFGRFRFPLFYQTKQDMRRLAQEKGFGALMDLTWFCHAPRPGMVPCGQCSPCVYAMEEGMQHRLPLPSRLRYHFRVKARVRHWLMNHPALHQRVRKLRRTME